MTLPLLLSAQHGFVVRSSHNDAVLVRQPGVVWIVFVERTAPHCRPQIVSFEPEYQFENFCVELLVVIAEFFMHPPAERGRFIIQENAAILHCWRPLYELAGFHVERVFVLHRNIRPPVPRRDPHLLREIVDAVDRASFVTARDDQRVGNPWHRLGHDLN